jgi:hypothetical protein
MTGTRTLVLSLAVGVMASHALGSPGAGIEPGTIVGPASADQAKGLLPPEVLRHYESGDYINPIIAFPDSRWDWDEEFKAGTRWNAEHLTLDEHKSPIDQTTGKRPPYLIGLPFPHIAADDPDAGVKVVWNLVYAYYNGGNSHNWIELDWVSRRDLEHSAIQDVYFLYYEGQPRQYSPARNSDGLLFQFIAISTNPADLQGTAALSWRFKDPMRRDLSWAYVPALRRVRAVSPSNRSDGFLGSDTSQDDGFFFDGKPEDFTWKVVDHKEQLRLVDADSVADKVVQRPLAGGGWRTTSINRDRSVGYMAKDWRGVAWAPVGAALAKRRFWVVEGVPKDRYYLYGRLELWIDDVTWQGAWSRKFSWQGELLNVYEVMGFAAARYNDRECWWGSTMNLQISENLKADQATVTGLDAPGRDPPNDRRIPLEPSFFDFQTLNRFGK